jgi:hypothetical protein
MNGMQSAAAYVAAAAGHSTQAQPAHSNAQATMPLQQMQLAQQQQQQQAPSAAFRAFARFRKPEPIPAQRDQEQKSRADIQSGTYLEHKFDETSPDEAEPNALLTEEHIQFLINHHLRTRQSRNIARFAVRTAVSLLFIGFVQLLGVVLPWH